MRRDDRPTFYYNDDQSAQIRACGVLMYAKHGGQTLILLRETKQGTGKQFSDLGGKTNKGDASPLEVAVREANEESNNKFTREGLYKLIDPRNCLYNRESKYLLYFAQIEYFPEPDEVLGVFEETEQEAEHFIWHDINEPISLHIRMPAIETIRRRVLALCK